MIKIATRKSALAMWQSQYIANKLLENNKQSQLIGMKTKGDVILDAPLAKIGGKGLFTKELEESMLKSQTDIAVHSLKDVPTIFPKGLILAAITERVDPRDALLSDKFNGINELPNGAKVGTTSLRRRMQLLAMRPDLNIVSLRGNVQTRLSKLHSGEFDAIVLAMAGVIRLNLDSEIKFVNPFSIDEMIPAMGQAALGIESRTDIADEVEFLNDPKSVMCCTIERDFVHTLNGGCQAPIGVHAVVNGEHIEIKAIIGMPDASEIMRDCWVVDAGRYKSAGREFANAFIARGAKELLKKAEDMAAKLI